MNRVTVALASVLGVSLLLVLSGCGSGDPEEGPPGGVASMGPENPPAVDSAPADEFTKAAHRPPADLEWPPEGVTFWVGGKDGSIMVQVQPEDAAPFFIAAHPVTNAQYARFVGNTEHTAPDSMDSAVDDAPVVGVSLADAAAYAEWAGLRLPSAAELKAASGPDAYPWGDEFDADKCPTELVGTWELAAGASPDGVLGLCGPIVEHCSDADAPTTAWPTEVDGKLVGFRLALGAPGAARSPG